MFNKFAITLFSASILLLATPLFAEDESDADQAGDTETDEHTHRADLVEVIVRAHPLSKENLSLSYEVLHSEELARKAEESLGETIENLPGIRSASFGQAVGRPVVHGLHGVRVKTLIDRTDTMDVSALIQDHPVTADPYTADSIEIIKGPGAMIYGTESIGGIVNVATGRIPHTKPDDGFSYRLNSFLSDNADQRSFSGRADIAVENLVLHGDFSNRSLDDYEIPSCLESHHYMESEQEEHEDEGEHHDEHEDEDEEHHDDHEVCDGHVPNSFINIRDAGFGVSRVNELGYFGVSFAFNEGDFGIPVPHSHGHDDHHDDHEDEEEHHDDDDEAHDDEHEDEHDMEVADGLIVSEQKRIDFDFHRDDISDGIKQLNARFAMSDYEHDEIEGATGEVDSKYINDAYELQLDMSLDRENTSIFGFHLTGRDYEVQNNESPVAPVSEQRMGVSWLYERPVGSASMEFGSRFERKTMDSSAIGDLDFSNYALSLGFVTDANAADWVFGVTMNATSRAPAIEEVASQGLHFSTNSIELGNPSLGNEVLRGFTVTASREVGNFETRLTGYHRRFSDYIFVANTGLMVEDVPVFSYLHADANFTGLDIEAIAHTQIGEETNLDLRFQYDTVSVSTDDSIDGPITQLPADRMVLGLAMYRGNIFGSLDYTQSFEVTNTAAFELPTDSWTDVSATVEYRFAMESNSEFTVYLKGKNLTDDEQREHVSLIKDRVPLPGRTLELGFRLRK